MMITVSLVFAIKNIFLTVTLLNDACREFAADEVDTYNVLCNVQSTPVETTQVGLHISRLCFLQLRCALFLSVSEFWVDIVLAEWQRGQLWHANIYLCVELAGRVSEYCEQHLQVHMNVCELVRAVVYCWCVGECGVGVCRIGEKLETTDTSANKCLLCKVIDYICVPYSIYPIQLSCSCACQCYVLVYMLLKLMYVLVHII